MGIELRMPNIMGNEREQLIQIRSYLYQLIPQFQWALNNVETSGQSETAAVNAVQQAMKGTVASSGSPVNAGLTFEKLKPLIIKSAEIVEAYYEEINKKLSGVYVAESDFGTFKEETEKKTKETSTYIEDIYSNHQLLSTDLETFKESAESELESIKEGLDGASKDVDLILKTTAHIRSGEIDIATDSEGNEYPVYGLEIGQITEADGEEVFNKYARFTAGGLSFYDQNGTEVAYISDYRLYIRDAEVRVRFKLGGLIDTVMNNGDVVTKWVGGDI